MSKDVTLIVLLPLTRWHDSVFALKDQVNMSQAYPLDVDGSPGDDGAISLGLHVVVQVRCALVLVPVDLVAGWKSAKTVVPLIFFFVLQTVVHGLKLPAFSLVEVSTQQDVVSSWRAGGYVWELVAFLCQGSRITFPIGIDRSIVVGPCSILAGFLASEKTGFVAVNTLFAVGRISMLLATTSHD